MIVIFDIEGVLVDGEFLPSLARKVGKEREVREITLKGIKGEINWEEGLARRIQLLKGISYDDCVSVAMQLPIMHGAREMAGMLKQIGCITIGVSGGFSFLANRVKEELGLDHVFSNELVFHDGKLIGYGLLVNANKASILRTALGELLDRSRKVAVVDGANDIDLFNIADLRIAFNAQDVVKSKADVIIDKKDLREVIKALSSSI